MDSLRLMMLFLFSYILLHLPSLIVAQPNFTHPYCRNDVGNYTANSTFGRNLNSLLSSLYSNTQIDYGFYNLSVGQTGPDQANAIGLCRGDIGVDDCRSCIRNSTRKILQVCPYQKEGSGVYDTCMLRYSNKSIFGVVEGYPVFIISIQQNATDTNQFNQALQTLLSRLRDTAVSGNSLRKFATGNESAGFDRIYGLVQCTPDLSLEQCDSCLAEAFHQAASCCSGLIGARITTLSCNLRYETSRFFESVTPATPPLPTPPSPVPPPPPAEGKKSNKARTIIIIVVPTVSVVILIICISIFLRIPKPKEKVETVDEIETADSLQFSFNTICVATEDFSEQNKLGQGGFGAVYKVWRNWREGIALDIIDPILRSGSTTEMMRCIHIGLLCVQENVADRPTMASVLLMLSSSSITLQIPSEPAFFMSSSTYQSDMSSSMGNKSRVTESSQPEFEAIPLSENKASISELYPR
ncbi:unnamed protein product [Dovyalis caffra]|uniref:Gnk2-homologous domain-containing protein n=1 Tax=Dovyalis caffra TaxID=77055 RepID=A0AAV1SHI2_9ROSI|nr:unnamed protein product [Dovyalis caffra]